MYTLLQTQYPGQIDEVRAHRLKYFQSCFQLHHCQCCRPYLDKTTTSSLFSSDSIIAELQSSKKWFSISGMMVNRIRSPTEIKMHQDFKSHALDARRVGEKKCCTSHNNAPLASLQNSKCQFAMPTVFHQTDVDGVFRSLTNYLHFLRRGAEEPRAPQKVGARCFANTTFTTVKTIQSNPSIKRFSQRLLFQTLKSLCACHNSANATLITFLVENSTFMAIKSPSVQCQFCVR